MASSGAGARVLVRTDGPGPELVFDDVQVVVRDRTVVHDVIFSRNFYDVIPRMIIKWFPDVRSIKLKGRPYFADFNLVPKGWDVWSVRFSL
ncbi:hypothetical protein C1H46_026968 [Malus baccata]|uniref:Transport inhibitor response 1 domain-containing protein n=1 Tax=Malus baccata TaxID=106549 RepID=A0A540LLT9_MALBA|nr:hypothetical protein C1H46_026968 [Malus baccata]